MVCPIYEDLRMSLVSEAMLVNPDFGGYSDMQKLCFLLSDSRMVRSSSRVCTNVEPAVIRRIHTASMN